MSSAHSVRSTWAYTFSRWPCSVLCDDERAVVAGDQQPAVVKVEE
jgi:hypothetical protein